MELTAIPDTSILAAIIVFIVVMVMRIHPPKNINVIYGYRTSLSMSSKQRWDFAQEYSANRLIEGAVVLLLACLCFALRPIEPESAHNGGIVLTVIILASLFIRTEIAIKKQFPNP